MTDQPENAGTEPENRQGRKRLNIPKIDLKLSRGINLAVLIVGLMVLAYKAEAKCIPADKIFSRLELDETISFLDGH